MNVPAEAAVEDLMSLNNVSSTGGWSLVRRISSVVVLSASLVASSITPALARGGRAGGGGGPRGGGGQMHGGGARMQGGGGAARAAPQSRPAPSTPATRSGRTGDVNRGSGNINSGNRNVNRNTNVGNRNVNVNNVNVRRNTVVRPGGRAYGRAPYAYGGRRYYAHNAYRYHAYRPYGFGVGFRPFGAFVATVAATAVIVSIANTQYRYNQGVWYAPASGGYTVVAAPVGGVVTTLPPQATVVNNNNYYYGGSYYEKSGSDYKVVAPQAGTIVEQLPEGGEEVTIGEQKYVKFGETYYQPIEQDGKQKYEVVEVK